MDGWGGSVATFAGRVWQGSYPKTLSRMSRDLERVFADWLLRVQYVYYNMEIRELLLWAGEGNSESCQAVGGNALLLLRRTCGL